MGPWPWDQAQDAGASTRRPDAHVAVKIATSRGGSLGGIGGGRGGVLRHSVQCPIGEPEPVNRMYASIALFAGCPANKLTDVIIPILVGFNWQGRY
jgi:hypothetical protein